jgi:hypothetical protein
MPVVPTQIRHPIDIVIPAVVRASVITTLLANSEVNLVVGVDIHVFPNRYNILILEDASGENSPVECQCVSFYDPAVRKTAGDLPVVRLSLTIVEPPESAILNLVDGDLPGYL